MRRIVIGIVIVLLIACIAIPLVVLPRLGGRPGAPGAPAFGAGQPAALRKATIDRGDLRLTVSATGSVVAKQQSTLSFDQPGRVLEVLAQQGQKVEAGQLLARQDDSTQKAALQQAEYSYQAAMAYLQKLLAPVDAGDIAKAEADVKAAQGGYSALANATSLEKIKSYELQYQQAQTAAKQAETLRMEAGGRFAPDDPLYTKAVAAVGEATFNAEIARLRLEQARNGRSLGEATANIAYYQARLLQIKAGPKAIDVEDAQVQLAIAKLQRDQVQRQLDKTKLVAPYAGVISTVNAKVGEVSTGAAMVITNNSAMYIDVKVDEVDIGKIKPGQPVELTIDALPGVDITGKVQRIAQTADATASVITYPVRVVLNSASAPIKVGMTTNAVFVTNEAKNVVRIPNLFLKLNRSTNQATVNLANPDGTFTEVAVKLGLQGSDYSEVMEGLSEGDTVVLLTDTSATK